MSNMNKIKLDHIGEASLKHDADTALHLLMTIAGITSGDVAAQVFSGFQWDLEDQWTRVQKIAEWIRAEKCH